jgi:hypothetical protein
MSTSTAIRAGDISEEEEETIVFAPLDEPLQVPDPAPAVPVPDRELVPA